MPHNKQHDLNALKHLLLIYRLRSVTKAAAAANLTQPAMSRILNKLRDEYQDRLFIRQHDELIATPKTELLVKQLAPLLNQLQSTLQDIEALNPNQAEGQFIFTAPAFVSQYAMQTLPTGILEQAPKVNFNYRFWPQDIASQLKNGSIDLAFGLLDDCPNHVKHELIAQDHYALFYRPDHPISQQSEAKLEDYSHIHLAQSGIDKPALDNHLYNLGLRLHKIVSTADLNSALILTQQSDYLFIAPKRLSQALAPQLICQELSEFAALAELQQQDVSLSYQLFWGVVKDQDPLHSYIRNVIKQGFLSLMQQE